MEAIINFISSLNIWGKIVLVLAFVISLFVSSMMILLSAMRLRYSQTLEKNLEQLNKEAEENYAFWAKKLKEEQIELEKAMHIIDKEYHDYIINKRKNSASANNVEAPKVKQKNSEKKA